MNVENSSIAGYLSPTTQYPEDDTELDHIMHDLFTALASIHPTLVRPRWQNVPGNMPQINTEWIAHGVIDKRDDLIPSQWFVPDEGMHIQYSQEFDVLVSFYGDRASWLAGLTRDGLALDQNRWALTEKEIFFLSASAAKTVPVKLNERFYKKVDVTFTFRRSISRIYPVLTILSAEADIHFDAQDHEITTHVVINSQ